MALTDQGSGRTYKVKLSSGRVLGPLDLALIKRFILKNQIIGKELARVHPDGQWVDINQISEIAELLVLRASGSLKLDNPQSSDIAYNPILGNNPDSKTSALTQEGSTPQDGGGLDAHAGSSEPEQVVVDVPLQSGEIADVSPEAEDRTVIGSLDDSLDSDDRTTLGESLEEPQGNVKDERSSASIALEGGSSEPPPESNESSKGIDESSIGMDRDVSQERTVMFQKPEEGNTKSTDKAGRRQRLTRLLLVGVLCVIGYQMFFAEPETKHPAKFQAVRPKLPSAAEGKPDPIKSNELYAEAMRPYVADTALGYRRAADLLREALSKDISNVKALAMLASSYINLIDSSNKDENYFSVLSTLIDMSRAKSVDLGETVIADVEFYLVVNKAEVAQNRVVQYTQSHPAFGVEMFYYLALAFHARGDENSAVKYLSLVPDNKVFSSKIYYLKGQVAEALGDTESAKREYLKAISFNSDHAKSYLRMIRILYKNSELKGAQSYIEFLVSHLNLLAPKDEASALYFHALFSEMNGRSLVALNDMERAVTLDPENHEYLLELYTLRSKEGENKEEVKKIAKMYYFLSEGEKLVKEGKYQGALVPFLQAREANDSSFLPLLKMGDMFNNLHNIEDAKANYKLAAERARDNIQVWSRYIDSLIQSYEWEEATQAMDRFRKLPVSQSSIDKAAADMNQKQGNFAEAQVLYRKAMGRDGIDSSVYAAYARSLMSTKNFKDAPFFLSLALRFDPLNVTFKIDIAKCIAETESIDRAISMLQDEMSRNSEQRPEYLAAVAELQIQKGSWEEAKFNIAQAMQMGPDYAYPWKLRAQVFMNQESTDKTALDQALDSYKSYSERNPSDPSGYLERYKIFAKKADFEKAKFELDKIYAIYPKYPNLHYFMGALYSLQGNHKIGAAEFGKELENNPNNFQTLIAYGKELMELGQIQPALTAYTKAMTLNPRSSEAKQEAGWANLALKNYQASVSLLRGAIDLDRANPLLYKRLGLVYRSMNDLGSACSAFKKYLEMEPDAADKAEFSSCL